MYEEYFGLKRKPFSIVPDPSYFFMSEGHREALAHLLYGIQNEGGFVLLTGEVGTGKTTACRRLLQLIPDDVDVAFILNPKVTAPELLAAICDEFGIKYPKNTTSIKTLVSRINDYLIKVHEKDRRAVVIIEEAQNLEPEVLEQIRLLTNLETNQRKLLQMIMLGQPELRDMLAKPDLRQLSQRITARYHLGPLTREEVPKYVEYRLSVAGLLRGTLFPPRVTGRLYRLTGGVPRLINAICDRALLGAYVQGNDRVDMETLAKAAREVLGDGTYGRWPKGRLRLTVLIVVLALLVASAAFYEFWASHRLSSFVRLAAVKKTTSVADPKAKKPASISPPAAIVSNPVPTYQSVLPTGTLDIPADTKRSDTKDAAYRAIFQEWKIDYSPRSGRTIRAQARRSGLGYLSARGGIADLRQMNRPAVLRLTDPTGAGYYAVLIALKGDTATFKIGTETRLVATREIALRWDGDYTVLWRQPPGFAGGIWVGRKGPLVDWLAARLAAASGKKLSDEQHVYDRSFVEQVKQFQLSRGITPDGVVGPKTIIALGSSVPDGDPVLFHQAEGN
jgi:general secretion pathway protein A